MVGAFQVGNGAGDAQGAVVGAGRQLQALGRTLQQGVAICVLRRDLVEQAASSLCIHADGGLGC